MTTNPCDTCRFALREGCARNVCAVVRMQRRSEGVKCFPADCIQANPEPMTPDGMIGFRVGIKHYPPTRQGYIEARAYQGTFNRRAPAIEPQFRWDTTPMTGTLLVWEGDKLVDITLWGEKGRLTAV